MRAAPGLLVVLAALLGGCAEERTVRVAQTPASTTYRSAEWGYSVSIPDGWQRAEQSLTPNLFDPREILSLGTFPLRYRGGGCAHVAGSALEDMTADDVFLTIQERGLGPESESAGFPPRPAHFRFQSGRRSTASAYCVRGPVRFVDDWFGFGDAGRHFHVLVAVGTAAPEARRREAYRILDSLRFDPAVKPDWPSSG